MSTLLNKAQNFASFSSYKDFLHLSQLKKTFSNFLQAIIISIYQASLGSVDTRVLKITTHRSIKCQVLISLDSPTTEIIKANTAFIVEFYHKGLIEAYFKLKVEFIYKAQNSMFLSTNSIASATELEVIKE